MCVILLAEVSSQGGVYSALSFGVLCSLFHISKNLNGEKNGKLEEHREAL